MNQTVLNRAIEKLRERKIADTRGDAVFSGMNVAYQSCIDLLTSLLPEYQKELEGEAVAALGWLLQMSADGLIIMSDGEFYWEEDHDGDQPMDEQQLYEVFKQHPTGKNISPNS